MIGRQGNWLGQMRIDAPHIRAAESSVAADFDVLAGQMLAGKRPVVLKGFNLIATGAVGAQATALQLNVPNGLIMHYGASEAGTIFWVPSTRPIETLSNTNARVSGSFTASSTNYVGLDMSRTADASTSDNAQFLDPTTRRETARNVPLARTLDYRIVIGSTNSSSQPTVLPLAKVITDSLNNVVSIQDARQMMFRLGTGGDFPNIYGAYTWPGTRAENVAGDVFAGGDKVITSMKEWMDAAMTRMWDLGGGEFWYSATADRNVNLIWTGATFTNGENFEWTGTNLHWKGIKFLFDNSSGSTNTITNQTTDAAGLTDLADGECLYVDLDRTSNATVVAVKAVLTNLGSSTVPGARNLLAWRVGGFVYTRNWRYPVGTTFIPATTTSTGVLKISRDYAGTVVAGLSALNSPVAISDRGGTITCVVGSNHDGLIITADGNGSGLSATSGGGAGSIGVTGSAAGVGSIGVQGNGPTGVRGGSSVNGGVGGEFFSAATAIGTALTATSFATNGSGVIAIATGTGTGIKGSASIGNGIGVWGVGSGSQTGVVGDGGATGLGGLFTSVSTAAGVMGVSSAGIGGDFIGTTSTVNTAALRGVGGAATTGVFGGGGTTGSGGVFIGGNAGDGIHATGFGAGKGGVFVGGATGNAIVATAVGADTITATAAGAWAAVNGAGSASGTGGYFVGGNGIFAQSLGASAAGLFQQGSGAIAIDAIGHVRVSANRDYQYIASVSRVHHVSPAECTIDNNGSGNTSQHISGFVSTDSYIQGYPTTSALTYVVTCRVRLPATAVLGNTIYFKAKSNNAAASTTRFDANVQFDDMISPTTSTVATNVTGNIAASPNPIAWYARTITSQTVPEDGYLYLRLEISQLAGGACEFHGFRIPYTQTTLRPT